MSEAPEKAAVPSLDLGEMERIAREARDRALLRRDPREWLERRLDENVRRSAEAVGRRVRRRLRQKFRAINQGG
jgi:hypothetical protein